MRKVITSSSDEEKDDKEEWNNGVTLVGVIHSSGQGTTIDSRSGSLGPGFYHWNDNGEYA